MKSGSGGSSSKDFVTPPKILSRSRECPYAPMTSMSAAQSTAWRRRTEATLRPTAGKPVDRHLHAMTRKVGGRVGARFRAVGVFALDGIDKSEPHLVGRDKQVERFADRPGVLRCARPTPPSRAWAAR